MILMEVDTTGEIINLSAALPMSDELTLLQASAPDDIIKNRLSNFKFDCMIYESVGIVVTDGRTSEAPYPQQEVLEDHK